MANCTSKITLLDDSFTVCGDYGISLNNMLSTDVSSLTSLKDFKDAISSELIDAKTWKTSSSYPTLRLLYDRYMNSTDYCNTESSKFDYCRMMEFSELVGTYWVDLIEQVVPSTTIWGSTYVYGNTIFDQQKFKYKKYTLFNCELPDIGGDVVSPVTGWTDTVTVEYETLQNDPIYDEVSGSTTGQTFANVKLSGSTHGGDTNDITVCTGVGIIQSNCGSEFVGRIMDFSEPSTGDTTVISECAISVEIPDFSPSEGDFSATAYVSGDIVGPVSYEWSNGQTTQTATGLMSGTSYTVTVYDLGIEGCSATANISITPK
jgi:hypothetical protein